jgi:hypothetical protein
LYALAYRSGKGTVAALVSTNPRLSTWIFRPKRTSTWNSPVDEPSSITEKLNAETLPLTVFQGGCEWHLLRIGHITSTVGYQALQYSFNLFTEMEKLFLQRIGVKERVKPLRYTLEYLNSLTPKNLRLILQNLNETTQGTKVCVDYTYYMFTSC